MTEKKNSAVSARGQKVRGWVERRQGVTIKKQHTGDCGSDGTVIYLDYGGSYPN